MVKAKPVELYSIDAESAVLDGLIIDNTLFDEIADVITLNDFYLHAHQVLFKGIYALLSNGKSVDILILDQYFTEQSILVQLGGFAYVADLVQITPITSNFNIYVDIFILYSKQRMLLKLGQHIISEIQATKSAEKLDELLEDVENNFLI